MSKFIISGFADEIDANFMTQLEGLNKLSIGYIEVRGVNGKNISELNNQEVKEAKTQLNNYGIKVSAIGSPIGKIKITDDFEAHLETFKRVLETAITLETNYMRIFSFFMPHEKDPAIYRDEVMLRLQRLKEVNKGSGITLLHENEKDIYGDIPERCLDILKTLGGDDFQAVFDPANFIQCGCVVYPNAFDMLKPFIKYMHIKDALANGEVVPAGYGLGNIETLLKSLKASNYEGFVSLEPHLGSFEGLAALENTGFADKLEKSGFDKFELAHQSLVKILESIA
ncbi:MAG: sugar phosphate isomerase/epimerase [Hyphomonadaceae bacterium]|nr:sugar phosphate isomerase/epimerase [Clostridia bacterium]